LYENLDPNIKEYSENNRKIEPINYIIKYLLATVHYNHHYCVKDDAYKNYPKLD